MLKLSQNIVDDIKERNVKKVKIFFYTSWCSWTKIDLTEDFEIDDNISLFSVNDDLLSWICEVYIEQKDLEKLENCNITKVVNDDKDWHNIWKKFKYIFSSGEIKDRCWCWTSFSFEKKIPKLNFAKLKWLKDKF